MPANCTKHLYLGTVCPECKQILAKQANTRKRKGEKIVRRAQLHLLHQWTALPIMSPETWLANLHSYQQLSYALYRLANEA